MIYVFFQLQMRESRKTITEIENMLHILSQWFSTVVTQKWTGSGWVVEKSIHNAYLMSDMAFMLKKITYFERDTLAAGWYGNYL